MKWWTALIAALVFLFSLQAEAGRLAGGKSMGRQSGNVTQREAAPAAPSQGVGNAAAKPAPAVPAPAAPRRPWGAMLGGLAAGLGLAWLAHSMGMGEGMGQILLIVGALLLAFMVFRYFMQSRRTQNDGYAYAGDSMNTQQRTAYRPENVGNDASARPWEREQQGAPFQAGAPAGGSMIGSALSGSQAWGVPSGFDTEGFVRAAKANFITLQAAWDKSDISSLRAMMTDGMLTEIRTQLSEREAHTGAKPNHTEVLSIDAHLLGIEELADEYMASVEFTGMIREEPSASPSPFREVWNMTKPKSGGGWLVAGVQALQ
jgi:predicted lipid-binding transport protein (Tim44 family)